MVNRDQLLEAALTGFPEGLALLGRDGAVAFWNPAAEIITGFPSMEMVGRSAPGVLGPLLLGCNLERAEEAHSPLRTVRYSLVHAQHRAGRDLVMMMRSVILRDEVGERIGTAVVFHSAGSLDLQKPEACAENGMSSDIQDEMAEQAQSAFEDFIEHAAPLGLLWIRVDQAHELRRSHGARAFETMMERVKLTLAQGLRPAEELGRWSEDEFLILSHESTPVELAAHAQVLAGLARTSDFRWWGDRLTLTVSVGAAQALRTESLPELLGRTQAALFDSIHAGGNHITLAPERSACLRS